MDRFYISTPIYYSNDVPHIGHTATTVFADIVARYNRLFGKAVLFTTGNDEHGEKVAEAATKNNRDPQEFVDELVKEWENYWVQFGISYDLFVRTTNSKHKEVVSELLSTLKNKEYIYKGIYKGVYCIGCEEYKTERQLVNGICPLHRPDQVVTREEENYKFKLSKFAPIIKSKIEKNEIKILPEGRRQEILSRLNEDIEDLSISRPNVEWGIKVPWDNSHTVYVWVEALMNYYTNLFILDKKEFWPADVHFVGKDIVWFHTVIWPAILEALDLPLPKSVFAHSFLIVDSKKMSKSLGNVISPKELISKYGVDGTRYLLAASIPYENDSDVSFSFFDERYNADLANGLGNLVSRVAKLAENLNIEVKEFDERTLVSEGNTDIKEIEKIIKDYRLNQLTDFIKAKIDDANLFLNEKSPWANTDLSKAKNDVEEVIKQILEIATYISGITPETSNKMKDIFKGKVKATTPLFNRV